MNRNPELDRAPHVADFALNTVVPKIVVGGACGAGKSSLLNALVKGHAFEVSHTEPCTRANDKHEGGGKDAPIVFIDSPGFSEADRVAEDYSGRVRELIATEAHLYLLVIGAPNRSLDVENRWLQSARSEGFFSSVPGLVAVNKIDMIAPVRDWNPKKLNLATPTTEKERNISTYCNYISTVSELRPFAAQSRIIPVCAGENFNDPLQYNIETLRHDIFELLPDAAKIEFGRQTHMLHESAETVVNWYAAAAMAEVMGNVFGMGTDAAILIPMQIAMVVHIGKIFGQPVSRATAQSLIGAMLTTIAGKTIVGSIVLFVPVVKNFVGPPIAGALTKMLGRTAIDVFSEHRAGASSQEIEAFARRHTHLLDEA